MSPDRLTYMANQIGKFFAHKRQEEAVAGIADHIRNFWEKRMLAEIYVHLDAGGTELDERPRLALQRLREPANMIGD